ncbi:MAG: FtsX-like permease family protein [Gammaproteobacteria bacterium]|nr:FtsX-like permease family protein [Gammaproteobacteria bacterium]
MRANNPQFFLTMEWRTWLGQRGKLLFLLVGFALMCALLALLLRLGDKLFHEPPAWANPGSHVYTFAREHADGRLSPIPKIALERIQEAPGIRGQTSFVQRTMTVNFLGLPEEELQTLFIADNFAALLGIEALSQHQQEGAWVSARYFQDALQGDEQRLNSSLQHRRIPRQIPILGVLPAELNRIGGIQPDIWLSQHYLSYLTPFVAESTTAVERFLLAAPDHYGLLVADQPMSVVGLNEYIDRQDLSVPGMNMASDGSQFVVYRGINLDPPAKQRLLQQWQLLLVVIVAFVVVLALNTFSMFTSRLIQQANSYRIQRVLGANVPHLIVGPLLASAIMILVVALLSLLFLAGLNSFVSVQSAYLESVGNTRLAIHFGQWLAALGLVAVLLIGCACLPVLRFSRQPLFGRQTGESRSKGQKWLAQTNLASQLVIALIAISFLSTLGYQQWRLFQSYELNSSIQTFSVRQLSTGFDLTAISTGNLAQLVADDVAFELSEFTSHFTNELNDDRLAEAAAVQQRIVSGNYFNKLGVPLIEGETDWQQGLVINQTLARLLRYNTSTPLIGSSLNLGMLGSIPIVGIVADLPHQGFSQTSTPAFYLHFTSAGLFTQSARQLELYYHAADAARIRPALQVWFEDTTMQPHFSTERHLASVVAERDRTSRALLLFCAVMIALVVSLVFTSLRYQIRNRMVLERQEYGVLMALGAPDWRLFLRAAAQALFALAVAIPFGLILLSWLLQDTGWLSAFELTFSAPLFMFGLLLLCLLTFVAAQLPVWQLTRQPIFSLLRTY